MVRVVTRNRFGRTAGVPVQAFNPEATQLQLLTNELNRAKLQSTMDALQQNDPESFVVAAEQLIKEGSPDAARLKPLVEVAKQNIEEKQWQNDLKTGSKTLEQFQSYLQDRLDKSQPGSVDASHLISALGDTTNAIKARDENAKDQQALLDYTKTQDNVAYADYLRQKLARVTDPTLQGNIATQINTLSERQTKKESAARAVARESAINDYMTGKTDLNGAVQTIADLRNKAATPEEAKAYQTDINNLFQNDIAKKRNSIVAAVDSGQMGTADAINQLRALAQGPADEQSINNITTAIDHVRSVGQSKVDTARVQGISSSVGNASQDYYGAQKAIKDAIASGQSVTPDMLQHLKDAGDHLSQVENAAGDFYEEKGNAASAEKWHKQADSRSDEVTKTFQQVDDNAMRKAGVTSTDEANFDKRLAGLPADQQVKAITDELGRINQVKGVTSAGNDKLQTLRDSVFTKGQVAANDAGKLNDADKSVLTQAYADYKARGGKESEADFNAYLKDLNAGRINVDSFNYGLGLSDSNGKAIGTGKNKTEPYTLTGTPAQSGPGGQSVVGATPGSAPDRVLYDAMNALNAGGMRSDTLNQQLAGAVWNTPSAEDLSQQTRDQYIENYRENIKGNLGQGTKPTITPVQLPPITGMPTNALMGNPNMGAPVDLTGVGAATGAVGPMMNGGDVAPVDNTGVGAQSMPPAVDPTGDMWSQAFDKLKSQPSNFDLPQFNVAPLPDVSPIQFDFSGAFNTGNRDLKLTTGDLTVPPPNYSEPGNPDDVPGFSSQPPTSSVGSAGLR